MVQASHVFFPRHFFPEWENQLETLQNAAERFVDFGPVTPTTGNAHPSAPDKNNSYLLVVDLLSPQSAYCRWIPDFQLGL